MNAPLILDEKTVFELPGRGRKVWRYVSASEGAPGVWIPFFVEPDNTAHELPYLPLVSQQHFLMCPCFEALCYGNRGSGKSLTLCADFLQDVGRGFASDYVGMFLTRSYKGFESLVSQLESFIKKFYPGAVFLRALGNFRATFPDGEQLYFRVLDDEEDFIKVLKGRSVCWLGIDELTMWESPDLYLQALTILRSPNPNIKVRVRAATNPGRAGSWIQSRFNIPQNDGIPHGPEGLERVALNFDLFENFILLSSSKNYPEQLLETATSREKLASDLLGIWSEGSTGLFSDIFEYSTHVVPPLTLENIPTNWFLNKSYDHGSSAPFACLWFAESDGSPVHFADGTVRETVRGDVFLFSEWYGCGDHQGRRGLKLTISEIADGILSREREFPFDISRLSGGVADSAIFNNDVDRNLPSLASDFSSYGVEFEPCAKGSGSRSAGYELIRTRLSNAYPDVEGRRTRPGLFICSNCEWSLRLIPSAPRDPQKVDEVQSSWPDHLLDCLRYRLASEGANKMWRRGF